MSDQEKPINEIPASVMINGGHTVTVRVRAKDPMNPSGEPKIEEQKVRVRLVPLSQAGEYLDLVGLMPEFVAFCCGKFLPVPEDKKGTMDPHTPDIEWVDTIIDDDLFALEAECRKYNDPRTDRWLERQKATVKRIGPKAQEIKDLTSSLRKP